jgi:hypothetical protein
MSLFDGALGQPAEANTFMPPPQSISTSSQGFLTGRTEKLRRQLAVLLPCQEDVDILSDTSGWWLVGDILCHIYLQYLSILITISKTRSMSRLSQ